MSTEELWKLQAGGLRHGTSQCVEEELGDVNSVHQAGLQSKEALAVTQHCQQMQAPMNTCFQIFMKTENTCSSPSAKRMPRPITWKRGCQRREDNRVTVRQSLPTQPPSWLCIGRKTPAGESADFSHNIVLLALNCKHANVL